MSSSARRSSRSSWIRPTRSPRSRTSVVSRRSDRADSRASARASRCATCTRRTTAASAPSRRPKGRTSALSPSLSCFARINEFGFIESPYRKVVDGRVIEYTRIVNGGDTKLKPGDHVTEEDFDKANRKVAADGRRAESEPYPFYLTAWEEDKWVIGQANIELGEDGYDHQRAQRLA